MQTSTPAAVSEEIKGRVGSLFMRCFFTIVFNCLLFLTRSSDIDSSNISKAMHPELLSAFDLSQTVFKFNDLQACPRWHGRNKEQFTQTIYACAVFLIVLYLYNLHHSLSPSDWVSTPRVRFYNNATIHGLTIADRVQGRDGSKNYGSIMILLPVLHQYHWSVYRVNFDQSWTDVLDSNEL